MVDDDDTPILGSLVAVLSLMAACALAPLAAVVLSSPWLGVVGATASFWVWGRFGPRPMPGFLAGLLCLWGFSAILGAFVVCAVLAVRGWLVE